MAVPGIFVYHPRTPSPLPVQSPSANFSSHHHRVPYPHSVSAKQMAEYRANEFWPHPRAAVEAGVFSHGRYASQPGQDAAPQTISYNPEAVSDSTSSPKEWDEWEKNKNWPFPASLPPHEVAKLRKMVAEKEKANAARAEARPSSSRKPALSAAAKANANWPLPANALGSQAQNPVPSPVVAQPAPRTAAQRSQWPPPDFQWAQQPHNTRSTHTNGYSTEPEGSSRGQAYSRRTQPQEPASVQAPTSNMFGRLKSALSGKRKAEPTSPTDPQASNQDSSSRRVSKKQNTQQIGQGRHEQVSTRVQIASYLRRGSPSLVDYDLRFSDRYVKKAVQGGLTHMNADDLDMPACNPPLPYVRIYVQELTAWTIEVRPPAESRFSYVTVGDVLYTTYKTLMQRVDPEIWEADRRYEDFQERVNRAFSRRCLAVSRKKNMQTNDVAQMGLLKVDYLGSRYQFAGLTHTHGSGGGEWFMMESVTPRTG